MLTTASITRAARSERSIAWRAAAGEAADRQIARLTPKARAKQRILSLHVIVESTEPARRVFMCCHSLGSPDLSGRALITSRCDHPYDINKRRDRAIRSLTTSSRTKMKVHSIERYRRMERRQWHLFSVCGLLHMSAFGGRADIPDWRVHAVLSDCRGVRRCTRVWTLPRHYSVAALEKPSRHPERKGQGPRRWLGDARSGRRPEYFRHR